MADRIKWVRRIAMSMCKCSRCAHQIRSPSDYCATCGLAVVSDHTRMRKNPESRSTTSAVVWFLACLILAMLVRSDVYLKSKGSDRSVHHAQSDQRRSADSQGHADCRGYQDCQGHAGRRQRATRHLRYSGLIFDLPPDYPSHHAF